MWEYFSSKLSRLDLSNIDIFVGLQSNNDGIKKSILLDYPEAHVFELPNRGRDVLPFLIIAKFLKKMGYLYVLKIHSKKSDHRTDGKDWLSEIIDSLIPDSNLLLDEVTRLLIDGKAAIIGPKNQYLSLRVNFEANGFHITKILNKIGISDNEIGYMLQKHRGEYGFFAGTMFWVNLKSIEPVIDIKLHKYKFERENGQIDGTYAHAMERIFCLVPEYNNQKIYSINNDSIEEIEYDTGAIPDWSNVYIGPAAE